MSSCILHTIVQVNEEDNNMLIDGIGWVQQIEQITLSEI